MCFRINFKAGFRVTTGLCKYLRYILHCGLGCLHRVHIYLGKVYVDDRPYSVLLYNAVPDREIGFQTERHQNSLPSVFALKLGTKRIPENVNKKLTLD